MEHASDYYFVLAIWGVAVASHAVGFHNRSRGHEAENELSEQSESPEQARQELLVFLQNVRGEFDGIKRLQWNAIYYAILADAALVGASQLRHPPPILLSALLAIIVGTFAVAFLYRCHEDLSHNRRYIKNIYARMGPTFKNVLGWDEWKKRDEAKRGKIDSVEWLLLISLILATVFTTVALLLQDVSSHSALASFATASRRSVWLMMS